MNITYQVANWKYCMGGNILRPTFPYFCSGLHTQQRLNFLSKYVPFFIFCVCARALCTLTFLACYVCKRGSWPNSYLGLPLNAKPHTASFRDPILEKMRKKLSLWENSLISKGGRVTLLQASYPISPSIIYLSFPSNLRWQRSWRKS